MHVMPMTCDGEAGVFCGSFPIVFSGSSYVDLYAQFLCTSKHFSLVLDILKYLLSRSSYRRIKFLTRMKRMRRRTKHDFAAHQFHTLAMLLGHVGGTVNVTFAITRK